MSTWQCPNCDKIQSDKTDNGNLVCRYCKTVVHISVNECQACKEMPSLPSGKIVICALCGRKIRVRQSDS